MPQIVTITGSDEPRLTMSDVPPGALFVSVDGDVCLRSQPAGFIVTNLSKTKVWFHRSRYWRLTTDEVPEGLRLNPERTMLFNDGTPIQRVIQAGETVTITA